MSERVYDLEKEEAEPCLRGTDGCSIDHKADAGDCEGY